MRKYKVHQKKKGLAEFHSRHFYSATIAAKAFPSALREVEKYPSIVGFEPGTLALKANVLTNFAERTVIEGWVAFVLQAHCYRWY